MKWEAKEGNVFFSFCFDIMSRHIKLLVSLVCWELSLQWPLTVVFTHTRRLRWLCGWGFRRYVRPCFVEQSQRQPRKSLKIPAIKIRYLCYKTQLFIQKKSKIWKKTTGEIAHKAVSCAEYSAVIDKLEAHLSLSGSPLSTQKIYIRAVRDMMESLGSVPEALSVDQIKAHLAGFRSKLSSSALNSRVCGIKYYFRKVVQRPDLVVDVPNPRVAKYVQEVLSETENWTIYAKRPFGGPKQVIEYLGRYTHYLSRKPSGR